MNKTIPYLNRYFTQLTPLSKKLSRDARLVNKAMEELDKMAGHGENLELGANNVAFIFKGSDYSIDYHHNSISKMTKAEKLKMIFAALKKKNNVMQKGANILH